MYKATFDPAQNLDLYFRKGRNGSKELRFFYANGNPYLLTDTFLVKSNFGMTHVVLDNKITLSVTDDDTDSVRRTYFWELVNETKVKTWLCGASHFTDENSAAVTDSEDITITLDGEPINITINESGGTGTEHYKGTHDASGDVFPSTTGLVAGDFYVLSVGGNLNSELWPADSIIFYKGSNQWRIW